MAKGKNSSTNGTSGPKERTSSAKKATPSAKKRASSQNEGTGAKSPAARITERINELGDWRGDALARIRKIVKQADSDIVEEWKYRGVPVWYHNGIVCTGETYKDHVKMTFAKGASLKDPSSLLNGTLGGHTWRAIDIHEGDHIDANALKALIREAVDLNTSE